MHTLRHYRIRLWRSERLPYRTARLVLLVLPVAFIALALAVIAYNLLRWTQGAGIPDVARSS